MTLFSQGNILSIKSNQPTTIHLPSEQTVCSNSSCDTNVLPRTATVDSNYLMLSGNIN